jgi:heme A synthase
MENSSQKRKGRAMSLARAVVSVQTGLWQLGDRIDSKADQLVASRQDRFVWIIVIAIAVVIALGLLTAWFVYCQSRGGWPALDMPSWSSGGTWKVYCAK